MTTEEDAEQEQNDDIGNDLYREDSRSCLKLCHSEEGKEEHLKEQEVL